MPIKRDICDAQQALQIYLDTSGIPSERFVSDNYWLTDLDEGDRLEDDDPREDGPSVFSYMHENDVLCTLRFDDNHNATLEFPDGTKCIVNIKPIGA